MKKPLIKDYEFNTLPEYIEALEQYIDHLESNTPIERGITILGGGLGLAKTVLTIAEHLPENVIMVDEEKGLIASVPVCEANKNFNFNDIPASSRIMPEITPEIELKFNEAKHVEPLKSGQEQRRERRKK